MVVSRTSFKNKKEACNVTSGAVHSTMSSKYKFYWATNVISYLITEH